ncbi:MAG: hypothetical protein JWN27_246 [Candidatus Eremiobacteraeota bacterium]|nr:hypothetical protein [Candidatus Eremiobacteraeota bacterium]
MFALLAVLFVRSVTSASGETISDPLATPSPPTGYSALDRARDEALAAWLPRGEDIFEPWRRHLTAQSPLGSNEMFSIPNNATLFVRVRLVYDADRGVALYYQGCCAWQETVLMIAPKPPPQPVQVANLRAVRTPRGIGLGASPAAVVRAYGPARLHASTTTAGLRVLSYYRDQHVPGSGCGWFENFVFRANRLVEIQSGHGC